MAEFKVRTNGGADPQGKPRVYFCCHPDDFDRYFDKICNDVLKTHDCAICYTEDMNEPLDENNINEDLGRYHLFLVPITKKLLTTPCRAMQVDLAFAKQNDKSILPFMMEEGIGSLYELPENFDKLQYISPYNTDATAISYEIKLKKLLDEKLLNAEMIKKIKDEFDSYIFLSYRKKDRGYANELMKTMHSIPGCRDIAIWFDEFIIPGEDWLKNINHALDDVKQKSNLFTLLVTPHLFEYTEMNGQMIPNFVMREEYPAARKAEMDILAAEMEETDHDELHSKFEGVPDPVTPDDEHFSETMVSVIKNVANNENDDDPRHNYLIGLAYINGIDVEVNVELGLELITESAEAEYEDAMKKLYEMYYNGDNVKLDYTEALKWAIRLVEFCKKEYGDNSYLTMWHSINLANTYRNLGDSKRALEIFEQIYETLKSESNLELSITDVVLYDMAIIYREFREYQKALELSKRAYDAFLVKHGEGSHFTIDALGEVAMCYFEIGSINKALETIEEAYKLAYKYLGNNSKYTVGILANQAFMNYDLGKYKKALEMFSEVYDLYVEIYDESHPNAVRVLEMIANCYKGMESQSKALEIYKGAYDKFCDVLGEDHPSSLTSLGNIAIVNADLGHPTEALETLNHIHKKLCDILGAESQEALAAYSHIGSVYSDMGKYEDALDISQHIYQIRLTKYGEEHGDTLNSLYNLAVVYHEMKEYTKALEIYERVYEIRNRVFGLEDIITLGSLENIAVVYCDLGNYDKAMEIHQRAYELKVQTIGEKHPKTILALHNIAVVYYNLKDYGKTLEIDKRVYALRQEVLGDDHPLTIECVGYMADVCKRVGDYDKAVELWEKVYNLRLALLEENHPDTIDALEELAGNYLLSSNGEKALELFTRLYDILCKKSGETDPRRTLKALNNVAAAYEAMFMYKEALLTHQRVYELRRQALGEGDVATIRSLRNIALSYYRLDMDEKVIPIYEEAYRISCKYLGKNHPDTIKALDEILFHCPDQHKYLKLLYYRIIRKRSK